MAFSSSADAQPDVLGAVFKNVGSQLWGAAVGAIPGGAGVAVSAIIGVAGAMSDELERAAAAQHSYELASFMTALRTDTLNVYQQRTTALETSTRDDLGRQFSALAGSWEPGQTRVVGDKAQFLRELRRRGVALLRAVPRPIAYQAALTRRWITDRRAGGAGLSSEDFLTRVGNGRIRLKFNTTVSGGSYSYAFVSAKLFTSTHSGQAADMVNDLMTRQHKHVYELGIPVDVLLRTENVVGGRSYFRFGIRSASDYDRTHWHPPARRAWSHMSWDPIDRITRISGG